MKARSIIILGKECSGTINSEFFENFLEDKEKKILECQNRIEKSLNYHGLPKGFWRMTCS